MQNSKAANCYKKASLETASPGKIILMLYDGALRFMDNAMDGFEEESCRESNEQVNNNILRALQIVAELKACLDLSVEGDFPQTMQNLYLYIEDLLSQANVKKDLDPIKQAYSTMKELRDAWAEMLQNQEKPAVATASISCSA